MITEFQITVYDCTVLEKSLENCKNLSPIRGPRTHSILRVVLQLVLFVIVIALEYWILIDR